MVGSDWKFWRTENQYPGLNPLDISFEVDPILSANAPATCPFDSVGWDDIFNVTNQTMMNNAISSHVLSGPIFY